MATTSSYLTHLPPVLWSPPPPAGAFGLGSMLCAFEKVLTGIPDGIQVTSGDGTVATTVIQDVTGGPAAQTVRVRPGTGTQLRSGSSYAYDGAVPEVISVVSATVNTITAVIRQDHLAGQAIINSGGVHPDIQSVIAGTAGLYGAWTTPAGFFDWLAQWVALQASPAWDDYARRTVLAEITGIYAARGTRPGLARFFDVYAVARQRPRVAVDDARKLLFCRPQAGRFAPVPALVSQRPLVAPQCLAITPGGYLLVGDEGSSDSTIRPAIWRISPSGGYDYSAGPPARPNPFAAANAPVAVAADSANGGAYLIDLITDYLLYRLTAPQTGTVTLTGTPTAGQTGTFTVAGTSYTFPQTGGATLAAQAAAWAAALGTASPFSAAYTATAAGAVISIAPTAGEPGCDLTLVATSSPSLQLTATGPAFASSTVFASGTSAPPLGLVFPRAMVVNGAGHPLILDRGASVRSTSAFPPPSQTAVVDVQVTGTPPAYAGVSRHALPVITEPLSMALRADGSLVIGDGAAQGSAAPGDLVAVSTTTWTATSLLGGLAPGANPLVSPVGIVEADAEHLWVLDAGLRPYVPSGSTPFTSIIAAQAAIYSVDLSVAPPVVTRVSEFGAGVYPRAMAGAGQGTLYACDSGLPDITGYSSRKWRSGAQQMSVVVQFQGDPARSVFCLTLAGTPTSGETCTLTLGGLVFPLAETTGNSLAQQAAAWAAGLNGTASFSVLYTAVAVGNLVCLYPAAGTSAAGVAITAAPSPSLPVTGGRLAMTVTLAGTPTTGESAVFTIGGTPYTLAETTGQTLEQQAAAWAAALNATAAFSQAYTAAAAGPVLSLSYLSGDASDYLPPRVTPSAHLTLTPYTPPLAAGQVALSGTPTGGESGQITLNGAVFTLAESSGLTPGQQAAAWCATLNATASFAASYLAVSAGDAIVLFATAPAVGAGIALSAVSSPHLFLQPYSENQYRNQFLQSIRDVLADEVPAQARWYLQSQLSQL